MERVTIKIRKNYDFDLIIHNSIKHHLYFGIINEFRFYIKRLWKLTDNYKMLEYDYEN